jgi:hypothetical protein
MPSVVKAMAVMLLASSVGLAAQTSDQRDEKKGNFYKASLVQAAPGKLLELIRLYQSSVPPAADAGEGKLLWMRHSQGDHWDLLILCPSASLTTGTAESSALERQARKDGLIAWQEDTFVKGPPVDEVKKRFADAGFFHVEMFGALLGKDAELYKEREMENDYSRRQQAASNQIYTRKSCGAWDLFTIGFYKDLKDYAESADRPEKDKNDAAKAAGFGTPGQVGPYLRTLISTHHDTLATAIKK